MGPERPLTPPAPRDRVVGVRALEASLAAVARDADPVAGLFGPDSAVWSVVREAAVLLGGGRAALLQLAHPPVAQAIADHSAVLHDVRGRFQRTMTYTYALVFGSVAQATAVARALHRRHAGIVGRHSETLGVFARGDRYRANDVESLLWVAATLLDSAVLVRETVVGPLDPRERDAFCRDMARFCALFGVPRSACPDTWAAFRAWFDAFLASPRLAVGHLAPAIAQGIFTPPRPLARAPFATIRLLTAGWMPPPLRAPFGLRFGAAERAAFAATVAALRVAVPRLPARLRYCPAWFHARRRLAGREGVDPVAWRFSRLALALLQPR